MCEVGIDEGEEDDTRTATTPQNPSLHPSISSSVNTSVPQPILCAVAVQHLRRTAMNRYHRGPTIGGPSKASANTLCQKCLKKDMSILLLRMCLADHPLRHYSYECKAIEQERPYVSRPSRTQQLLNPKLVPKLTSDVPQDLLRKKGIADEQLAKIELERGRKRERQSEEPENSGTSKKMRSASASSLSVSTISTNLSRSPSPHQSKNHRPRSPSLSQSPSRKSMNHKDRRFTADSRSPPPRTTDWEKKRRRASSSSAHSYVSNDREKGEGQRAGVPKEAEGGFQMTACQEETITGLRMGPSFPGVRTQATGNRPKREA
ncbi:hypothetical protein G7Y89_g10071 [Cudoniella acicularis]|uniref:Uncharacterized protein n=1 Tax=Cudoniella acicularis TaxID=354080 RepID=A0A8H4RDG1_9HELO|nr:hypothetical protein G7Y89_g10071 [Cudoniella acicularis]